MLEIPNWLKEMVGKSKAAYHTELAAKTQKFLDCNLIPTVCQNARCPNRGKCFCQGEATIMILGSICTRFCRFCAVEKGCQKPLPPAVDEPQRAANLAKVLNLKYLVLTMPTRDDLIDGGAEHIAKVCKEIIKQNPNIKVEALISDLGGKFEYLPVILNSGISVLGHNMETVPSLYKQVRPVAKYERSLELLAQSKKIAPKILTKSGLMLGLGETEEEIKAVLRDLRKVDCDLLTLGQYLAPSKLHYEVKSYPTQDYYDNLKTYALGIGFKGVMAGPLVRSSYQARELYEGAK